VFWIVDNGSSHCGWTAAARLSEAFPNAVMIHTGPRVVAKPRLAVPIDLQYRMGPR